VTRDGSFGSLDGRNIALWQSHGWYYEQSLDRWEWQRARIFQTVEDLYPQSYVLPFLIPMLENAGAYVMTPRERDTSSYELIIDRDGGHTVGTYAEHDGKRHWRNAHGHGFGYTKATLEDGDNPFRSGSARMVKTVTKATEASKATWTADIPADGVYAVYVSYVSLPESAQAVNYRVHSQAGVQTYTINQTMGGGTWVYLGHFPFRAGHQQKPIVEIDNVSATPGVVTADAVKIGGGMGNVARRPAVKADNAVDYEYRLSGYPRFTEGARYWLQWAGAPDSVYTPNGGANDYNDDYRSRGLWVNWLAGGSCRLPKEKGLGIPIDMSFAFHTDAGTTQDNTIIGTLGIYCTDKGNKFADGRTRYLSHDLTNEVITSIVSDVRAKYEPEWTRRQMWDKSYSEARTPQVPAMLLELLSHQNFADMKYGLDPGFRFTVSRAIYKGIVRYFAGAEGSSAIIQPLPIHSFAIAQKSANEVVLSWLPTVDDLESTATPSKYIIEERIGGEMAFHRVAETTSTSYTIHIDDGQIHSYRIIACNDGGKSFPSEVLAASLKGAGTHTCVTVVNGFTRVSGPDTFDAGSIAGFYDERDHGVPYIADISYIGSQTEFRRNMPWRDDDAAGFGASRANYETQVVAGNTFDYPYIHGQAIAAAGLPFVSSSLEAFENDTVHTPAIVDLILGKQKEITVGSGAYGPKYKAFPETLQHRLITLSRNGTDIFVSGAFVATDIWDNPRATESDRSFASNTLGYKWRTGQASIEGRAYQVPSQFKCFDSGSCQFLSVPNNKCYVVESPDSFYPADEHRGATIMRYGENNLIAGTAFDAGTYRTVVIGFPFETITEASARQRLMKQVLQFFSEK
jgi:hypothetical protein